MPYNPRTLPVIASAKPVRPALRDFLRIPEECVTEHYRALIERIGCPPGTVLMSYWPAVLTADYAFEGAP